MYQVLDMVGALEGIEADDESERKIEWRLTEAHTNSPPFTVVAEAYSKDPQLSVDTEAVRVTNLYGGAVRELLDGKSPRWLHGAAATHLRRALKRNTNGIGHTEIRIDDDLAVTILPATARNGISALERYEAINQDDKQRTEYGSVEGQVIGLTRYYSHPALVFLERLAASRVVCVLTKDLAERLGPEHHWSEAWSGQHLRIGGELIYDSAGSLKRINASYYEKISWAEVSLSDLRDVEILEGKTVQEHLDEFWGEQYG